MTKKQKILLTKIIISALFLFVGIILSFLDYKIPSAVLCLAAYAVVGYSVLIKAFRNIIRGNVFDENFLMLIASAGAIVLGEYSEAAAVMLFYQIGEFFEITAVGKSRKAIETLVAMSPDTAYLIGEDGSIEEADPEEVEEGSILLIKTGDKVPLDGVIISGSSEFDTSSITGESLPRPIGENGEVLSGYINLGSSVKVKTTREFENSAFSKIMYMVEEATNRKSTAESFISRFAKYYTPVVVAAAVLLAVIPSLITGEWAQWVKRALMFLVVSCPCALVISVPLSFFSAIGSASRKGILIKGSNCIENLAKAGCFCFDKTGTLTEGTFTVEKVCGETVEDHKLLEYVALAEMTVNHPIARSVSSAFSGCLDGSRVSDSVLIPGYGVTAIIDGQVCAVGNEKLMRSEGVEFNSVESPLTVLYASLGDKYLGYVLVADKIKAESVAAIAGLKKSGVKKAVMLTGDKKDIAEYVAEKTGIDKVYANLLPEEKTSYAENLRKEYGAVAYVGDGLNDAPVLACADAGIAMGGAGSDAAVETADIVIMNDDTAKVLQVFNLSRKTMRIVKENICFSLFVKFAVLILSAVGAANMWLAVFADVGVMILAILNALRLLKTDNR